VSEAVAVATKESIPPKDFAQVALAVFSTDEVLNSVRYELSLSKTPAQLLADGTLSAEAVEDTVAVRIVAKSPDRTEAQELADAAAQSLSRSLSANGLAKLTMFPATRPSTPQPPPRTLYALLGAAVGLAVVVLLAWVAVIVGRRLGWLGTPRPLQRPTESTAALSHSETS
jgi:capsular polysaccharide biosynthesis protein